jgi:hypothetical protein
LSSLSHSVGGGGGYHLHSFIIFIFIRSVTMVDIEREAL